MNSVDGILQVQSRKKLGDVLRERLAQETLKTTQGDLARAQSKDASRVKDLMTVVQFFEKIKEQLRESIGEGQTKHEILLGRSDGKSENIEVNKLLMNSENGQNLSKKIDNPSHPFHGTWKEFSDWAKEENLAVNFDHRYDGGGMYSWNVLTITPSTDVQSKPTHRSPRP